jgi:hypothetical protein
MFFWSELENSQYPKVLHGLDLLHHFHTEAAILTIVTPLCWKFSLFI